MQISEVGLGMVRVLFAEEAGEELDDDELAVVMNDLEDSIDDAQRLDQAESRTAIRGYLRRTRVCEHHRPQPGHPDYDGQRCPACEALEYGDRLCDERRGT